MATDYKHRDTLLILPYVRLYPNGTSVAAILQHSSAGHLRVYPALFELEQDGRLEVLEREVLGAPILIRKIQKMKIS